MSIVDIDSEEQLSFNESANKEQKTVLFFWANWHEPSKFPGGNLHTIFSALATKYDHSNESGSEKYIRFCRVEAEAVPEISEAMEITVVPTFVSLIGGKIVEKVEGIEPAPISALVKSLYEMKNPSITDTTASSSSSSSNKNEINKRLSTLINYAPVMLFMKGNSVEQKCGFSKKIVELLKSHNVPFASFDILSDEQVRQELKKYSEWPTYPQLYVKGELVGGLDILKEMSESADAVGGISLVEQLGLSETLLQLPSPPTNGPESTEAVEERIKRLINKAKVMLFMKGKPDEPRCGFSKQMVALLKEHEVDFQYYDILEDNELRESLKKISDWPTYPQLYAKGELLGGLDILKEMAEDIEITLKDQLDSV